MSQSAFLVNTIPGHVLLIAGVSYCSFGHTSGLYVFDGRSIRCVDPLPTAGLALASNRLMRLLSSDTPVDSAGELLIYDQTAVELYVRVDGLSDAHDVHWDGESILCTTTARNSVMWLSPRGEVRKLWTAAKEPDAWHVNAAFEHEGNIYCSAFGIFNSYREWDNHKKDNSGIIYNISEDRVEVSGLNCPHSPTWMPEGLLVCNSSLSDIVLLVPPAYTVERRLQLRSWTRGVAFADDYIFVGASADRKKLHIGASASLCIVDRRHWKLCEQIALPCQEIASMCLVPEAMLEPLRRGLRVNRVREAGYDNYDALYQTGTTPVHLPIPGYPLPAESCQARIAATLPGVLYCNSRVEVAATVENVGSCIWVSSPPNAVNLASRWYPQDGTPSPDYIEGPRTRLPSAVPPGYSADCRIDIVPPAVPGTYLLRITLVQEWILWFDDVDPRNAYSIVVEVRPAA